MVSINCTLGTSQAKHINLSSVDLCKRRNALNSGNRSMTDYTGKFLALKKTCNQQNDRDIEESVYNAIQLLVNIKATSLWGGCVDTRIFLFNMEFKSVTLMRYDLGTHAHVLVATIQLLSYASHERVIVRHWKYCQTVNVN